MATSSVTGNNVLTKAIIMKECVKHGYYRTPSCNEKLYLHHKGFDVVHPEAFVDYTDVKVLWLEGNCFSSLPCGFGSPTVVALKADTAVGVVDVDITASNAVKVATVAAQDESDSDTAKASTVAQADEATAASPSKVPVVAAPDDKSSSIQDSPVDIFQSMYPTLRQLFLHGNLFNTMPNFHLFKKLDTINLSDNFIAKVESFCPMWLDAEKEIELDAPESETEKNSSSPAKSANSGTTAAIIGLASNSSKKSDDELAALRRKVEALSKRCKHEALGEHHHCLCATLATLNMKNNHLKTLDDIAALLCFKNLAVLDLSSNKLEDGEGVLQILERMPNLRALQLSGNPCTRTIVNYRKTTIARCKGLMHLDDRPVFDDERRLVTAWAAGGMEAEKKERLLMKAEEEERHQRRLQEFRDLMAAARGPQGDTSTEDDTDSNPTPSTGSDNDDAVQNSNKQTINKKPLNNPAPKKQSRVLSSNRRAAPLPHTEFYEMNYGERSEHAALAQAAAVASAQPTNSSETGSVAFDDFRVVPKKAATSKSTTASQGRHQDPMAMQQVPAPSTVAGNSGEEEDDGVWMP